MIDMNEIIANNIAILSEQTDLAEVGGNPGRMPDSSRLSYTFAKL